MAPHVRSSSWFIAPVGGSSAGADDFLPTRFDASGIAPVIRRGGDPSWIRR